MFEGIKDLFRGGQKTPNQGANEVFPPPPPIQADPPAIDVLTTPGFTATEQLEVPPSSPLANLNVPSVPEPMDQPIIPSADQTAIPSPASFASSGLETPGI